MLLSIYRITLLFQIALKGAQSQLQEEYVPNETGEDGDISYKKMQNRNPDCAAYVGNYKATIQDMQEGHSLTMALEITADDTKCTFKSNNIPHHDVGGGTTTGGEFASAVAANQEHFVLYVPRNPEKARRATYVRRQAAKLTLNGIMLNGVDLDMDSSFCYNPEYDTNLNIALGTPDGKTKCGIFAEWFAVPAANPDNVVLDKYTGHAFNGRYHYHGDNDALSNVNREGGSILDAADVSGPHGSPVIGFAPDGFPIYGHYYYDEGANEVRKAESSWRIKADFQNGRLKPEDGVLEPPPIETHELGIFVEDWEYVEGSGTLDECNGMTDAFGNYGYYYTETYPYGPLCTWGAPDSSFTKASSEFIPSEEEPSEPELRVLCEDGVSTVESAELVTAVLTSSAQGSRQIRIRGISGTVSVGLRGRITAALTTTLVATLSHGKTCDTMMYQLVTCTSDESSSCLLSDVYDSKGAPIASSESQISARETEADPEEIVWESDSVVASGTVGALSLSCIVAIVVAAGMIMVSSAH